MIHADPRMDLRHLRNFANDPMRRHTAWCWVSWHGCGSAPHLNQCRWRCLLIRDSGTPCASLTLSQRLGLRPGTDHTQRNAVTRRAYLEHGDRLSELGRAVGLHSPTISRIVKPLGFDDAQYKIENRKRCHLFPLWPHFYPVLI